MKRIPPDPARPCFRSFFPGNEVWLTHKLERLADGLMYATALLTALLWIALAGWIGVFGVVTCALYLWVQRR